MVTGGDMLNDTFNLPATVWDDLFNAALGIFCITLCWAGRRVVNHLDDLAKDQRHCRSEIKRILWHLNLPATPRDE